MGCRIAFSDITGVAFSYFQDQLTTYRLSELFSTSQMVCHIMSWEQYHSVGYLRQKIRRESFFFNWDSLYARLNSHYKAWSYKNKKHKKIKADKKFLYKEPTKATKIKGQRKAFYNRQRIPESSCVRKKTVDIAILVTSRNGDRKIMKSIRIDLT